MNFSYFGSRNFKSKLNTSELMKRFNRVKMIGKGRMDAQIKGEIISYLDVFGDGLGSFRDGVSGKFSGENELDSRLNLT